MEGLLYQDSIFWFSFDIALQCIAPLVFFLFCFVVSVRVLYCSFCIPFDLCVIFMFYSINWFLFTYTLFVMEYLINLICAPYLWYSYISFSFVSYSITIFVVYVFFGCTFSCHLNLIIYVFITLCAVHFLPFIFSFLLMWFIIISLSLIL